MATDLDSVIAGIRASRKHFLKHLKGVQGDQWDWKPYPECKSIRETLAHLVSDDRASIEMLDKGQLDYEALQENEKDIAKLLQILSKSHEQLCAFIKTRYANTPLDQEIQFFSGKEPLWRAISGISAEDYYHAGQVAFVRMATNPSWDYYSDIYSE